MPNPAATATSLDAETVERVLAANLGNILAKVRSGATLSRLELDTLEASRRGTAPRRGQTARTQAQLARALGITKQSVGERIAQGNCPPPRPDGYDVEQWRQFIGGATSSAPGSPRQRLIEAQARRTELKFLVEKGRMVAVEDVQRWIGEMIAEARRVLLDLPSATAPQVVGLTIPEAERILRDGIHVALAKLSEDPCGYRRPEAKPHDDNP